MQELIARAKELLADGTVARVLGWKAGDLPYNPEAAYFETAESLDEFVYNGFCGQNLSKMMIEASKLEGKTLVCLKPCDTYSFNQLRTEVAAKTGTSQVFVNGVKKNNGFLITFAPYDNPEISVASVVELAGSGTSTAEITSSIIKYWYQNNTDEKTNQKTGALLN